MKIFTESGTIYILEDRTLTRLSEEPVYSYKEMRFMPEKTFDRIPMDNWDDPVVGQRMYVKFSDGEYPSTLHTSRVIKIVDEDQEHYFTPFERAER